MSEKDKKIVTGEYTGSDRSEEYRGNAVLGESNSHFSHGSYHTTKTNRFGPDPGAQKQSKDEE